MAERNFDNLTGRTAVAEKPSYWLITSLVAHGLLLALLFGRHAPVLSPSQLPGDHSGHQLLLTYLPGSGAPTAEISAPTPLHSVPDSLPRLRAPQPKPPSVPSGPSLTRSADSSAGSDSLGDGDIEIASLLVHPRPAPDLSQLPAGTRGDVVVDIVIDSDGRVAKTTVEHGLGHGVDEAVLATVQQWTFQPATRNGVPVSSEQELLFHYERG